MGRAMLELPLVSKKQEQTGTLSKAEEAWPVPTAILWVCRYDCTIRNLLHSWDSDSFEHKWPLKKWRAWDHFPCLFFSHCA